MDIFELVTLHSILLYKTFHKKVSFLYAVFDKSLWITLILKCEAVYVSRSQSILPTAYR